MGRWMVIAAVVVAVGAAGAARADESVARQASGCLVLLPVEVASQAIAEVQVALDANGIPTAIDVLRFEPENDQGREIALKAAEAIEACGPYRSTGKEETILIGPGVPPVKESVITMPD